MWGLRFGFSCLYHSVYPVALGTVSGAPFRQREEYAGRKSPSIAVRSQPTGSTIARRPRTERPSHINDISQGEAIPSIRPSYSLHLDDDIGAVLTVFLRVLRARRRLRTEGTEQYGKTGLICGSFFVDRGKMGNPRLRRYTATLSHPSRWACFSLAFHCLPGGFDEV